MDCAASSWTSESLSLGNKHTQTSLVMLGLKLGKVAMATPHR